MEKVPPSSPLVRVFPETPVEHPTASASPRKSWNPSLWASSCLIVGFVVLLFFALKGGVFGTLKAFQNYFDSTGVLFVNRFVGRSAALDQSVELISEVAILNGVLFVALLWFLWFKNQQQESRIRLFMGAVAAGLSGLLSRLLQLCLPFHLRPLFTADLTLTWPIGIGSDLNHWNSFPSDHASLFFALATLIWINDRRLGVFALFWAAIMSSTRIYLGYHYPTDIAGGAALGICLVTLSQRLPLPRGISRILEWERYAPSSFYAVAFIASYQAGTLFNDVRAIGQLIRQLLLRHVI